LFRARGMSSSELSEGIVAGRVRVGSMVVVGETKRGAAKPVSFANVGERAESGTLERL
jgi:hypothetical protein